jgi:hypothetical protein
MITLNLTPSNNVKLTGLIDDSKQEAKNYADDATLEVYEVSTGEIRTMNLTEVLDDHDKYFIKLNDSFYVAASYTYIG